MPLVPYSDSEDSQVAPADDAVALGSSVARPAAAAASAATAAATAAKEALVADADGSAPRAAAAAVAAGSVAVLRTPPRSSSVAMMHGAGMLFCKLDSCDGKSPDCKFGAVEHYHTIITDPNGDGHDENKHGNKKKTRGLDHLIRLVY